MADQFAIYKCDLCGNVVELLFAGSENLVCCGQPMKHMKPGSVDAATEKHVPVVEVTEKGVLVKVGSVTHPMDEKHYIQWIEVITTCGRHSKKMLKPGDAPEALFCVPKDKIAEVREYCNLHGLWKS